MSVPQPILSRIHKLTQMTIANGASQGEAESALRAIAKLMAEHGVQESDLELKAFGKSCVQKSLFTFGSKPVMACGLFMTIASVTETQTWCSPAWADPLELGIPSECFEYVFFGFPSDVEIATSIAQLVLEAFDSAVRNRPKGTDKQSFSYGFMSGLKAQLNAMRPIANANKSGALVVLKHQRVKDEMSTLGLNITVERTNPIYVDRETFALGEAQGLRAEIQRKVKAQA